MLFLYTSFKATLLQDHLKHLVKATLLPDHLKLLIKASLLPDHLKLLVRSAILLDNSTHRISLACPSCRDYLVKKGIAVSRHPRSLQSLAGRNTAIPFFSEA